MLYRNKKGMVFMRKEDMTWKPMGGGKKDDTFLYIHQKEQHRRAIGCPAFLPFLANCLFFFQVLLRKHLPVYIFYEVFQSTHLSR